MQCNCAADLKVLNCIFETLPASVMELSFGVRVLVGVNWNVGTGVRVLE